MISNADTTLKHHSLNVLWSGTYIEQDINTENTVDKVLIRTSPSICCSMVSPWLLAFAEALFLIPTPDKSLLLYIDLNPESGQRRTHLISSLGPLFSVPRTVEGFPPWHAARRVDTLIPF